MRCALLFLCAPALFAQGGTDPKPRREDYEAHGQAGGMGIGAEFMVHSFSGQGETYLAPEFLVVEVALYPPKGTGWEVRSGAFTLRLNGKKLVSPAAIGMVASSLRNPEWREHPRLEAGAATNGGGVVLGAPPRPPIPGRPPVNTPVPGPDDNPASGGVARAPRVTAEELLVQTALPEGLHHAPVSGYIYFPYQGKAGSLKTVELLYQDAVVKLR